MKLYGLAHCSTTKQAYKHLIDRGFAVTLVDYRLTPLTYDELITYFEQSKQPISAWLNTSGQAYRAMKDSLMHQPTEVLLSMIAKEPMLLKRPLLVGPHVVQAGYRESFYDAL